MIFYIFHPGPFSFLHCLWDIFEYPGQSFFVCALTSWCLEEKSGSFGNGGSNQDELQSKQNG